MIVKFTIPNECKLQSYINALELAKSVESNVRYVKLGSSVVLGYPEFNSVVDELLRDKADFMIVDGVEVISESATEYDARALINSGYQFDEWDKRNFGGLL